MSFYSLAFWIASTIEKFIGVTWVPDDFYGKLVDEINYLFLSRHLISTYILIRKLLENLIIDILRKKYGTASLNLYYDPTRRRFNDFAVLLESLDRNKTAFAVASAIRSVRPGRYSRSFLRTVRTKSGLRGFCSGAGTVTIHVTPAAGSALPALFPGWYSWRSGRKSSVSPVSMKKGASLTKKEGLYRLRGDVPGAR